MTEAQFLIIMILAATIGMFLWGRWRHDLVALASLLACVIAGLVPAAEAFAGFGHPAVITAACVLVLSRGLQNSGAVDALSRMVLPQSSGHMTTIAALMVLAAVLSAFMNNVGALALLMPVAIQVAERHDLPAGKVLMPLAFGSILGGMTTLIGTPPNLIVSAFRASNGGASFAMFDFTPVGLVVATAGIVFLALIGWRLVPTRKRVGVSDCRLKSSLWQSVCQCSSSYGRFEVPASLACRRGPRRHSPPHGPRSRCRQCRIIAQAVAVCMQQHHLPNSQPASG